MKRFPWDCEVEPANSWTDGLTPSRRTLSLNTRWLAWRKRTTGPEGPRCQTCRTAGLAAPHCQTKMTIGLEGLRHRIPIRYSVTPNTSGWSPLPNKVWMWLLYMIFLRNSQPWFFFQNLATPWHPFQFLCPFHILRGTWQYHWTSPPEPVGENITHQTSSLTGWCFFCFWLSKFRVNEVIL